MEFKLYKDLNKFIEETKEYLYRKEVENNLPIGILNRLKSGEIRWTDETVLLTICSNEDIKLVGVRTPPQALIVTAYEYESELIEFLIENLNENNIEIPGANGEKGLVNLFKAIYCKINKCEYKLDMNMRIYKLLKVNNLKKPNGVFREANSGDIETLSKWILDEDYMFKSIDTLQKAKEYLLSKINGHRLYLWEDKEVVSMAINGRETNDIAVITGVFTPNKFRKRGYATACVEELSRLLLNGDYNKCALFTDLSNPVSNSIYMKIGYEPVGDYDSYNIIKQ